MTHRCGFEGCNATGVVPVVEGRLYVCTNHVAKLEESFPRFRSLVAALRRGGGPKPPAAKKAKKPPKKAAEKKAAEKPAA